MAVASGTSVTCDSKTVSQQTLERLKLLYPSVNEDDTPFPEHWSPKDKYNFMGLTQNNLRVHYKGIGKTHKDAASVRANAPIPPSCGIYYYEVKIVSKGRDGYMGIGLSVQGVNLNRLPGWDTHSYGYHGDDGHSFCSSGQGKPYGPTFSTGDVIGCCVNLIDNTCFYTKNGVNLGIAFRDLPGNLYPTVGLQTPGEILEANFGQTAFAYDIEDYMKEWKMKMKTTITKFPVPDSEGKWQTALQKIVSTYLVHHGYCATAEAFARNSGQCFDEELVSIKNRQKIQKLVLTGRMGEAIEATKELYPGLLDRNPNLLFTLKCRQFIEMVNGTDSQVRKSAIRSPKSQGSTNSARSSPNASPIHPTMYSSSQQPTTSTKGAPSSNTTVASSMTVTNTSNPGRASPVPQTHSITHSETSQHIIPPPQPSKANQQQTSSQQSVQNSDSQSTKNSAAQHLSEDDVKMNNVNLALCANTKKSSNTANKLIAYNSNAVNNNRTANEADCDSDMDTNEIDSQNSHNGVSNGSYLNGAGHGDQHEFRDIDMDEESSSPPHKRQLCGGSQLAIEKMLQFGRELHAMSEQLKREFGTNESNRNAIKNAFSLLAYSDPWSSPVGAQLDPVQREPVCAALNSAILESHGLPTQPPLEIAIGQVSECMQLMSRTGVASCAFAKVTDYMH